MILIAASILAARKLASYDPDRRVPATMCAITDAVKWAEQIMREMIVAGLAAESIMEGSNDTKRVVQACLENGEQLLAVAKDIHRPEQKHIAFHLATMALEEVGKASMVAVSSLRKYPPPNLADDEDEERRPVDWIEDHERKLFWALWIPTFRTEKISVDQMRQFQTMARRIHEVRLATLYVSPEDLEAPRQIADEDLRALIELTTARLEMEKLKAFRDLDEATQQNVDWFFRTVDNLELRNLVLGNPSLAKLAELGGDTHQWIKWLRDSIDEMQQKNKELVDKELRRARPTNEQEKEPKWQIKVRLYSWSHSIRPKPLANWNKRSDWIKLFPAGDKKELLVQFTLGKIIPVTAVWNVGMSISWMLVLSLNIGTVGFFWWYLPSFVSKFYEQIVDLENKATILLERNPPLVISWGHQALKEPQLRSVASMFAHLVHIDQHQRQAYDRYFRALGLAAKNDMFGQFEQTLISEFFEAFRLALVAYGDWDGVPATFDIAVERVFTEQREASDLGAHMKEILRLADEVSTGTKEMPSAKVVTLDDVFKMKTYCDLFFFTRARRENEKELAKEKTQPQQQQPS